MTRNGAHATGSPDMRKVLLRWIHNAMAYIWRVIAMFSNRNNTVQSRAEAGQNSNKRKLCSQRRMTVESIVERVRVTVYSRRERMMQYSTVLYCRYTTHQYPERILLSCFPQTGATSSTY